MWGIKVTDNIMPQVFAEIRTQAHGVMSDAGELFRITAYRECPVSNINEPGYIHLRDTIGFELDQESTFYQMFLTFYVLKNYALFVNNGTSRMRPRPFFDWGLIAVQDGLDGLVEKRFRNLMLGHLSAGVLR